MGESWKAEGRWRPFYLQCGGCRVGSGRREFLQQQDTLFLLLPCHQFNGCASRTLTIISYKVAAGVV